MSSIICVHDVECYPSDCSSHGVCTDGVCHCEQLYTGMGCEKLNCSLAHCSGQGTCNGGRMMDLSIFDPMSRRTANLHLKKETVSSVTMLETVLGQYTPASV